MIELNVGGRVFATTKTTLQGSEYLSALISDRWDSLFVDRDPCTFEHVLKYLRGELSRSATDRYDMVTRVVVGEAALYYGVPGLLGQVAVPPVGASVRFGTGPSLGGFVESFDGRCWTVRITHVHFGDGEAALRAAKIGTCELHSGTRRVGLSERDLVLSKSFWVVNATNDDIPKYFGCVTVTPPSHLPGAKQAHTWDWQGNDGLWRNTHAYSNDDDRWRSWRAYANL